MLNDTGHKRILRAFQLKHNMIEICKELGWDKNKEAEPCPFSLDDDTEWRLHGEIHRVGAPAQIRPTKGDTWWLYGVRMRSWEEYQAVTNCTTEDLIVLILKHGCENRG